VREQLMAVDGILFGEFCFINHNSCFELETFHPKAWWGFISSIHKIAMSFTKELTWEFGHTLGDLVFCSPRTYAPKEKLICLLSKNSRENRFWAHTRWPCNSPRTNAPKAKQEEGTKGRSGIGLIVLFSIL
jgi:hypothetical protein